MTSYHLCSVYIRTYSYHLCSVYIRTYSYHLCSVYIRTYSYHLCSVYIRTYSYHLCSVYIRTYSYHLCSVYIRTYSYHLCSVYIRTYSYDLCSVYIRACISPELQYSSLEVVFLWTEASEMAKVQICPANHRYTLCTHEHYHCELVDHYYLFIYLFIINAILMFNDLKFWSWLTSYSN